MYAFDLSSLTGEMLTIPSLKPRKSPASPV
jgi:hypothetical protein